MESVELRDLVVRALEDVKAEDIVCLDVGSQTEIADFMVVASGSSNRQVKALVNNVIVEAKKAGADPIGVEGQETGEWVLVDLNDIIVHVMQPMVRDFYDLERLWSLTPGKNEEGRE